MLELLTDPEALLLCPCFRDQLVAYYNVSHLEYYLAVKKQRQTESEEIRCGKLYYIRTDIRIALGIMDTIISVTDTVILTIKGDVYKDLYFPKLIRMGDETDPVVEIQSNMFSTTMILQSGRRLLHNDLIITGGGSTYNFMCATDYELPTQILGRAREPILVIEQGRDYTQESHETVVLGD